MRPVRHTNVVWNVTYLYKHKCTQSFFVILILYVFCLYIDKPSYQGTTGKKQYGMCSFPCTKMYGLIALFSIVCLITIYNDMK